MYRAFDNNRTMENMLKRAWEMKWNLVVAGVGVGVGVALAFAPPSLICTALLLSIRIVVVSSSRTQPTRAT